MNTHAHRFLPRWNRIRTTPSVALVAASIVASLLGGCSILRAGPDDSRYFVLSSMDATAAVSPGRTRTDVYFGLGPVKLPGYLDTQAVVRSAPNGSIDYIPNAFWAEPLSDGFARALLYRTGARIGTTHAIAFPWYATTRVDWKVRVDVLRFEATTDGRAVLVARWSVARASDGQTVAGAESAFEESAGSDPVLVVDALSRCVDRLAETIAAAVTRPAATESDSGRLSR